MDYESQPRLIGDVTFFQKLARFHEQQESFARFGDFIQKELENGTTIPVHPYLPLVIKAAIQASEQAERRYMAEYEVPTDR
jgi:hypothetical protein